MSALLIEHRYRGPARSGNGGYTAGLVAAAVIGPAAQITLLVPPPLETPLELSTSEGVANLLDGDDLVATGTPVDTLPEPVEPVTWAEATHASKSFPGFTFHPFPTCYVCGTQNLEGLRIFPGQVDSVDGHVHVAAPWVAPAQVSLATAWAAMDCPGGWAGDLTERLMVLGRMTGVVDSLPRPGEECVVMGRAGGSEGRRTFTSSTTYGADGRLIGRAQHVWVSVDPARFN